MSTETADDVPDDIGEFFTPKDVAKLLYLSPMTVYRLIHAKELPAIKIGNSYRIRRNELVAYIERSRL